MVERNVLRILIIGALIQEVNPLSLHRLADFPDFRIGLRDVLAPADLIIIECRRRRQELVIDSPGKEQKKSQCACLNNPAPRRHSGKKERLTSLFCGTFSCGKPQRQHDHQVIDHEDAEIPLDTSDNDCLLIIEQTDIGSCQEHKKQNRCCNEVPDPCFRCIHPPSQPAKPNQQDEEQQHEHKWIKFEPGRSAELLPEERIAKRPHHSYSLLNRRLPRVQQLLYRCRENPGDIALADQEEKCSCTCYDKEQKSSFHNTCPHTKLSITKSYVFDDPLCKQKQRKDQRHQNSHIGLQKYQRKKTCCKNDRLLLPAFPFPVQPPACKPACPGCRRKICVQRFIRIQIKRIKRHKQNHTV